MATSTPNLNLILPDYSDKANISILNDNFQKIDEYCANGGVSNEDLQNAVKAANAWANATVSAESVSADNEADVKLTEGDNSKNLHFSIPRGQPGVLISDTEPTDPNVIVWVNPKGEADSTGITDEQIKAAIDEYLKNNPIDGTVTDEQIANAVSDYLLENPIDTGVNEEQLNQAVTAALNEAKESGLFNGKDGDPGPQGPKGDSYTLTDADKQEIAEQAADLMELPIDDTTPSSTSVYSSEKVDSELNQLSQQIANKAEVIREVYPLGVSRELYVPRASAIKVIVHGADGGVGFNRASHFDGTENWYKGVTGTYAQVFYHDSLINYAYDTTVPDSGTRCRTSTIPVLQRGENDDVGMPHMRCTTYMPNRAYVFFPNEMGITTPAQCKAWFAANPTDFIYQSTSDSGKWYIHASTMDADEYSAEIVERDAPLYENETVEIVLSALGGKPETVEGTGATEVEYSADTKAYIDSMLGESNEIDASVNPNIRSIGHRGYSLTAPENTLAAYRLAKAKGFSIVETDIMRTGDGHFICFHDPTVDRTTNGTGNVADMTLAQLKALDAGSWKSAAYTGERIPTFEEFLTLCRNIGLHPYIEVKTSMTDQQLAEAYTQAVKHGLRGKMTWLGFDTNAIKYISQLDETCRVGWCVNEVTESVAADAATMMSGKNEVFLTCNYTAIDDAAVSICAAKGIALEAWTVNNESDIIALPAYVTGVTSDGLVAGSVLYKSEMA